MKRSKLMTETLMRAPNTDIDIEMAKKTMMRRETKEKKRKTIRTPVSTVLFSEILVPESLKNASAEEMERIRKEFVMTNQIPPLWVHLQDGKYHLAKGYAQYCIAKERGKRKMEVFLV